MGKKEKKAEKEAAAVAVAEEPAIVKVIISNLKRNLYANGIWMAILSINYVFR